MWKCKLLVLCAVKFFFFFFFSDSCIFVSICIWTRWICRRGMYQWLLLTRTFSVVPRLRRRGKKRTAEEPIPRMKLALAKKVELEKAVTELFTEQYKLGFKSAQAQATLLCPVGTDIFAMNLLKRVKNDEIVSDDDEEEE